VSLRGRDCAPLLLHRIIAEISGSRTRRGLIERNAVKIERESGERERETLAVNRRRVRVRRD
jgi:hypothetical protein